MGERYALIVVGGGMSGLSAALTWALNHDAASEPVLLLEKLPGTGGFVTSYERSGYLFDTCQVIPDITSFLEYFGVDIDLKRFSGYYARVFLADPAAGTARVLNLPSGRESFKRSLMADYPVDAKKLSRFLDHSWAMYQELYAMKYEPGFVDILKMLVSCRKVVANASKSFGKYFRSFGVNHADLKEIFSVFAAFSGLPEDEVAVLVPVGAMSSLLEGAYRPTAGFRELPKQMTARLRELGGQVRTGAAVEKVLTENGVVRGVLLHSGEELQAENVITTVETQNAMRDLIGLDVLRAADPAYAGKVESVQMSTSSINIALGLDDSIDLAALGMDCGYNVLTTGGDTFERLFAAARRGESAFDDTCFHFGIICPSLTTGGKPNITIRVVPVSMGSWNTWRENDPERYKAEKERWSDYVIDLVERYVIPDLKAHIVVKDISTPASYARYSGSATGSIYDMASTPSNFGRTRLKMRTPIKNLYHPKFTHGVFGSIMAGMQAVDMIMEGKVMGGNARL